MYLLDLDKLEPGDIILTRSSDEVSERVRAATGSQFSHARLYVGNTSCIESDGNGVQADNLQRVLIENNTDVKVLRLKNWSVDVLKAVVFARQRIGTQYSNFEAFRVAQGLQGSAKEPNRQFCTRFVAQAYESAQIPLVTNCDYCSPEELLNSERLMEIPDVVRKANQVEIDFANSESPLTKQEQIHNKILAESRKISGEDLQTLEQLSDFVLRNPGKESEITNVLKSSGYLTMWQMDIEKNPWHYKPQLLMLHYKTAERSASVAYDIERVNRELRWRYEVNLECATINYNIQHQEYFKLLMELYKKLLELCAQRDETANQVLRQLGL